MPRGSSLIYLHSLRHTRTCVELAKTAKISYNYIHLYDIKPISTARSRRLRERRSRGVVMVAPVELGEGGADLLVRNGLLKEHETRDRKAVGEAYLLALERWVTGRGARITEQG